MRKPILFITAALLSFFVWRVMFPSTTILYRISIQMLIDEKVEIGSTSIAVTYAKMPTLFGSSADISIQVKGEAVVKNLGERGVFVMLLAPGTNPRSDPELIVPTVFGVTAADLIHQEVHGKKELKPEFTPGMARVRDAKDPKSVEYIAISSFPTTVSPAFIIQDVTLEILQVGILQRMFGTSALQSTISADVVFPWLSVRSAQLEFWQALKSSGYQPNSSVDFVSLFKRG
jgi:hypothetical protein